MQYQISIFCNQYQSMQIIHRYSGYYPFGLQEEPQNTYVELVKQNLGQEDITLYKLKFKFFREMVLSHVVKLIKVSRENNNLRFLYEYESLSLQKYLQQLSESTHKRIETSVYKYLLHAFTSNIEEIVKELVHYQIKTDLLLTNLAVSTDCASPFKLKLFLQPQCECFALRIFSEARSQELRDLIHHNKQSLIEFYDNQKKKMIVQFQELMEIYFGKFQTEEYRPNFIINGARLVFINNQEGKANGTQNEIRQRKKSTSSDKINFNMKYKQQKERRSSGQNNMNVGITSLHSKKINYGKVCAENENNKNVSKNIPPSQNTKNKCYIHFEPAQITKDHTMIVQEQEYIQSLQDQVKNMYQTQRRNSKQMIRTSPSINTNKIIPVNFEHKLQDPNKLNNNEPKSQKKHRYKMKIITSHDVQIEEEKDPQVFHFNHEDLKTESSDRFTNNNNQLCFKNDPEKIDNQYCFQQKEQAPVKKLFPTRYSDGDTFLLKKQNFDKPITTSLINTDQPQNPDTCICCKVEQQIYQFESKQPQIENYLVKIQSAKQKAQKLLRQYAKIKIKKL